MAVSKITLGLAPLALLFPVTASAMPDTIEELRAIVQTDFGGDPLAYVEEEDGDFRRMACRGRADLIEALIEQGLVLTDISTQNYSRAASCAWNESEMDTARLLFTADYISFVEDSGQGERDRPTLLFNRTYANHYEDVLYLLENGVHYFRYDESWQGLTREEHLLLAADDILDRNKEDAIRAFHDAGFGHIIDAARNEANVRYVEERAGRGGGGGLGGGLLGTIAGGVAGAYLGGTYGASAGILLGATESNGGGDEPEVSGPLPLATNRADLGLAFNRVRAPRGLSVQQLVPDGPADIAGMRVGDIIVSVAEEPVASRGSFYVATEKAFGMPEYEVEYLRGGQQFTAVLGRERPEPVAPPAAVTASTPIDEEAASASGTRNILEELNALGDLRDRGILSDEEFEAMKARILESP